VARFLEAVGNPSDRLLLAAFYFSVFCLDYLPRVFSASASFPTPEFIGFVAIAIVLKRLEREPVLRRWDYLALFIASGALIHPWRHMGGLALTGLGLLFCFRRDRRLAALGQLGLALACLDIWGEMALTAIEAKLLAIETALAYIPLSLLDSFSLLGNSISHPDGRGVVVEGSCSAFRNMLAVALLWLSFMKIRNLEFSLRRFGVLAAGLIMVVLLNTFRIDLCAWSTDFFRYWHEGPGVDVLSLTMLVLALAIFYLGLADAEDWSAP
jgi:hypothetical protein